MDALIEERLVQLRSVVLLLYPYSRLIMPTREISRRRNELLMAMHGLLKRRENLASMLPDDDEDVGVNEFLMRFKLEEDE
jgi:hypothetical protein